MGTQIIADNLTLGTQLGHSAIKPAAFYFSAGLWRLAIRSRLSHDRFLGGRACDIPVDLPSIALTGLQPIQSGPRHFWEHRGHREKQYSIFRSYVKSLPTALTRPSVVKRLRGCQLWKSSAYDFSMACRA
jgi:hypothetical protein